MAVEYKIEYHMPHFTQKINLPLLNQYKQTLTKDSSTSIKKQTWHYQPTIEVIEFLIKKFGLPRVEAFHDSYLDDQNHSQIKKNEFTFTRTTTRLSPEDETAELVVKKILGNNQSLQWEKIASPKPNSETHKFDKEEFGLQEVVRIYTHRSIFSEHIYLDFSTWELNEEEKKEIFFPVLTTLKSIEELNLDLKLDVSPSKFVASTCDIFKDPDFLFEETKNLNKKRSEIYYFGSLENPFEDFFDLFSSLAPC